MENVFYTPDFNAGIYYTNQNMFSGISGENLTKITETLKFYAYEEDLQRIIHIIGGYSLTVNEMLDLVPSFYVKWADFHTMQLDINTKLTFKNYLWCGFTYRTANTICFHGGFRLNRIYVGYVYEYSTCMPHTLRC